MRHMSLLIAGAAVCLSVPAALASEIGLPTTTFVQAWTPLPTQRFVPDTSRRPFASAGAHAQSLADGKLHPLLDDAFASARDNAERRGVALSEMTAPWDQEQRTAFQQLRVAEAAYAGRDDARHVRFVATLARVVDGTGRSAASDGSAASAALGKAYAEALSRQDGGARAATEATQTAWRAYSAAFAAFAERQSPGSADGVTAELARQRTADLAAAR